MVEVLMEHIALLPAESNIIVAGDFNVYDGEEPAYELLLNTNGMNTLNDPIDMPNWDDTNFPNPEIFTQSTRLSSLSDGAGGGMDDRFDFVLLSDQLMNPNAKFAYQAESYQALGNNGSCYNQDLIDCNTVDNVPYELLSSLYYMSDHLPVVLSLNINEINDTVSSINAPSLPKNQQISVSPNPANTQIDLIRNGANPIDVRIFNLYGKLMLEQTLLEQTTNINLEHIPQGLYIIQTIDKDLGLIGMTKLLIQR